MPRAFESNSHLAISNVGVLAHRNFQDMFNLTLTMLQNIREGRVLAVVGPSRAGKSELLKMLIESLTKGIKPRNEDDVPILHLEADLSDQQRMSLKAFTTEALERVKHPAFTEYDDLLETHTRTATSLPETRLRPMLIKSLKSRGTIYLIVDEAHHLLMTKREQLQSDILDALKNICNKAGVVLVLFGGYTLLKGLFQSAHFNGRLDILHFQPYTDSKEDTDEYASLLGSYQAVMTLKEPNLLVSNAEEIRKLYWGTLGATIDGLRQALSRRIARKARSLDIDDIRASRLPEKALEVVKQDVRFGAEFFKKLDEEKLKTTKPGKQRAQAKPAKKSKRKPFRKKPARRSPAKVDVG